VRKYGTQGVEGRYVDCVIRSIFMRLHHITGDVRPDEGSAPFFAARRGIDMPRPPGHAARRRFWVAKFTAPLQGWPGTDGYLAKTGSTGSSLNEEVYRY
jgi:hypothetical protein